MHMIMRPARQPRFDHRSFVGGVVVHDYAPWSIMYFIWSKTEIFDEFLHKLINILNDHEFYMRVSVHRL